MGNSFVWSDNWWVENEDAWFVDGENNLLFHYNFLSNKYNLVAEIPYESKNTFRLNSRCMKCNDDIYCMPDTSNIIWIYNLKKKEFSSIVLDNPDHVRIAIVNFWKYHDSIIAVSTGLKRVLEIDIYEKKIKQFYDIEGNVSASILVNDSIYYVSNQDYRIFEFNLINKQNFQYTNEIICRGLQTICYDGKDFWLSGYKKEIYHWNKEENTIEVLDCFPKDFGIYDFQKGCDKILDCEKEEYDIPTFIEAIALEKYTCFIPFQTNQIIYVDKQTQEIHSLNSLDESETAMSMTKNRLGHKFLVEYVTDTGIIALFSLKKQQMIDVDINNGMITTRLIHRDPRLLKQIFEIYKKREKIYFEGNRFDDEVYFNYCFGDN